MRLATLLLMFTLCMPPASAALSSVPSPSNSTIDPCLIVCPLGDIPFNIVVRDLASNPVINSVVVIDFCGCSSVVLCPFSTTDPYTRPNACSVRLVTDASGRVQFRIRAGGVCANAGARISADGVILANRNVASPDQDGNLVVALPDGVIETAKVGTTDPTGDLDCNGTVNNLDEATLVAHGGHNCPPPDPTPAVRKSWGSLKTIYR